MLMFLGGLLALAYLVGLPALAIAAWARTSTLQAQVDRLTVALNQLRAQPTSTTRQVPDAAAPTAPRGTDPSETRQPAAASTQDADPWYETADETDTPAWATTATPEPSAEDLVEPAYEVAPTEDPARALPVMPPLPERTVATAGAGAGSARPPGEPAFNPLSGLISWFMAGNPLAKLGIILLFFGVSYLLKYSADHNLFPIEWRLAGAGFFASGLLGLGWFLRKRNTLFGLILQGGAIGALYITSFTAFRIYAVLPHAAAFGFMLLICAASVLLAIVQDALSLAALASLGGYLAPVLTSTGGGSHIALFSYYALLSMGILVISLWKAWRPLNLIGFVFTFGIGTWWGVTTYAADNYLGCQLFLALNLLIFGMIAVLFALRSPTTGAPNARDRAAGLVDGTLAFGTPLIGFGLQYALTRNWTYGPAFSALGFAAFYLPVALLLLRRWPQRTRQLAISFVAVGAGFATLAIPLALSAQWTAMAWALEGLGVLWAGRQQNAARMSWSGSSLLVLALLSALVGAAQSLDLLSFVLVWMTLALCWLAASWLWARGEIGMLGADTLGEERPPAIVFLVGGICAWLAAALRLAHDLGDLGDELFARQMLILLVLTGSSAAWHLGGRRLNWQLLQRCAWLLWPLAGLEMLAMWGGRIAPLSASLATLAWLPLFGWALFLLHTEDRQPSLPEVSRQLLHAGLCWALIAFGAMELQALVDLHLPDDSWIIGGGLAYCALLIAVVWLLERRQRWPLAGAVDNRKAYWVYGLAPLAPYLLWRLLQGNLDDGRVPGLIFIPLLNPLEQGALFALLVGWLWILRLRSLLPANLQPPPRIPELTLAVLGLWWLNGCLLRLLASIGHLDWDAGTLWDSRLVQTSFAIAWTLAALACTVIASRRRLRPLWLVGAAVLGIVVLKLFLVDAADRSGLSRAIAFIGVAVLVLVIGYLAPLPPRAEAKTQSP